MTNLEIVDVVIGWYEADDSVKSFVENRWGQDLRYSICNKKLLSLGWTPKYKDGLYRWHK